MEKWFKIIYRYKNGNITVRKEKDYSHRDFHSILNINGHLYFLEKQLTGTTAFFLSNENFDKKYIDK